MKNFNKYIFEKLKINKDSTIENTMYYIIPRGDMYRECKEKYKVISLNNLGDYGFILDKSNIEYLLKKYYHKLGTGIDIYKIPEKYKNKLDLFKKDIETFEINVNNLYEIDHEEFK